MKTLLSISLVALFGLLLVADAAFAGPRRGRVANRAGKDGAVCVENQEHPNGPGAKEGHSRLRKRLLKRFDEDGDGKLSEAERAKAKAVHEKRIEKFDTDGDGKLSPEERAEMPRHRQRTGRKGKGQRKGEGFRRGRRGDGPAPEAL